MFIAILFSSAIYAYDAHVVLVHGILGDAHSMKPTKRYIEQAFGKERVYIKNVELGCGEVGSLFNMETQAEWLRKAIQSDDELKGKSIIIIAHSQGGLVARYFIEKYNEPHVHTYIALGTPQFGIFGTPSKIDDRLNWVNKLEGSMYRAMYNWFIQRFFSVSGYWRDTMHYNKYLKKCSFLPRLNNEIEHEDAERYKNNICALRYMVLVKAEHEDVVEPAASCHFGFYPIGKEESNAEIEDLVGSDYFNSDCLGLKTLYDCDRLHFCSAPCSHRDLQENEECFNRNILPYLESALNAAPAA